MAKKGGAAALVPPDFQIGSPSKSLNFYQKWILVKMGKWKKSYNSMDLDDNKKLISATMTIVATFLLLGKLPTPEASGLGR